MAITQDRFAALITAARSYQERYSSVINVIELLHKMVCTGTITATDAIERLHVQFGEKGLPLDATIVIEREFTHYNLTRKRNDYMREYQRRRRAGAGAFRAPYNNASLAPCGAPSDAASANAMSLAEIEAALARSGANAAPSAAFDAELSTDDLL